MAREIVVRLPERGRYGARVISQCLWRLRTFVERDAYVEYDWIAGASRSNGDQIEERHIAALNSVMRARSSRAAWAGFLGRPLPEFRQISADLDLVTASDEELQPALDALSQLVERITRVPRITEMAASKVLHLLRPRFVAIADAYIRDALGIWRDTPASTMLGVQRAVRQLATENRSALESLFRAAEEFAPVVPDRGPCAGHAVPVRLSRVRILDILIWSEVALYGATPHRMWSRWYRDEAPR